MKSLFTLLKDKLPTVIFVVLVLVIAGVNFSKDVDLGSALPVAGQTYYLAGGGLSSSATSFTLTSFTIPQSGALINDSQISDTFYLTVEPGNRTRQEIISCTTVVQNTDGTATISGCSRGLSPMTPFTASTSLQFAHSGGSPVVISNPPQLYEQVGFLENDELITGAWTTSITPTAAGGLATKQYVDDNVNGGTVSLDSIAPAATAGETIATGTIVYFDLSDAEWRKADSSDSASSTNVLLGIAQGAGTDGGAISGGVLTRGYDTTQVGMAAGQTIYLSDTAGATSTTAGTYDVAIGVAKDSTNLYFDPVQINMAYLNATNTWSAPNIFDEQITGHASTTFVVYTASTSWTKPTNFEHIVVEVIGGGGGGGPAQDATGVAAAGGGAGGYSKELLYASDLSATTSVLVLVGAGGDSGTNGTITKFGNFLSASGGTAGAEAGGGGTGGAGSDGDLNVKGGAGQAGMEAEAGNITSGTGGSSVYGGGGQGVSGEGNGGAGGDYGGGGGGAADASDTARTGGGGADGVVIITVYY